MPASAAVRAVDDIAGATAFEDTFAATRRPFSGRDISTPITVVFGGRDWLLTKRARARSALPTHTRWLNRPAWGHVPMWIDPEGVARTILDGLDDDDDGAADRASPRERQRAAAR
jgi:pimeloyl-ACP methyl ester carboxylesterase